MLLSNVFEQRRNLPLYTRHGLIIEGRGGGGSFIIGEEVNEILSNTDDRVIIIDCFGYLGLFVKEGVEQRGGQYYNIMPGSDVRLNLLSPSSLYEDKDFLLLAMHDLLFAIRDSLGGPVSEHEKSTISRVLNILYERNEAPTAAELVAELEKEGCSLELLSFLSSYELFRGTTNINLENRLTVFTMHPSRVGRATVFPLLEYIKNVLKTECTTEKRTWVYICEMDALLSGDYMYGKTNCLHKFWREARRYGAVCTGTMRKNGYTSDIDTLICNSDCFYLLEPSLEDKFWFDLLNVEPEGIVQMLYSIGDYSSSNGCKGSITTIR